MKEGGDKIINTNAPSSLNSFTREASDPCKRNDELSG